MAAQVALKRQQAAEDAIAMGMRCISPYGQLPPGPVFVDNQQDYGINGGIPATTTTVLGRPNNPSARPINPFTKKARMNLLNQGKTIELVSQLKF